MRFVYPLTVPANTPATAPTTAEAWLVTGRLFHVEIAIPPGPANLLRVVVKDKLFQIIPVSPDESLGWDDYTHSMSMDYDLPLSPHLLTLVGWNLDDTFEHTAEFRFDVSPAGGESERSLIEQLFGMSGLPGRF